jgi:16S rRNA processing protein RimM
MGERAAGNAMPRRVALGRIVAHFGIRGWLKVESYTEPVEAILNYRQWILDMPGKQAVLDVDEGRRQGRQVVVHFGRHDDRETSARWIGATVCVERSELPALGEREYYRDDLLGLAVRLADGRVLGRIDHFVDGPAHGFMVVREGGPDGTTDHWLPVTPQCLRRVDLAKGEVHVDWQPLED